MQFTGFKEPQELTSAESNANIRHIQKSWRTACQQEHAQTASTPALKYKKNSNNTEQSFSLILKSLGDGEASFSDLQGSSCNPSTSSFKPLPLAVTLLEKLFLGKASSLSQPHFPLLPQIWEIWFRKCLGQSGATGGHGEVDGEDTAAVVWERSKGHRPQRGHAKHLTQGIRRKQKADPGLSEKIGVC
ncbi:unnamed protein product [Leuciscus chuanchicus]